MITINKVTDGICMALNESFGDKCEIYTENVEQGLKEPCFSILVRQTSLDQVIGRRYFRTLPFAVHYFPESKTDPLAEIQDIVEELHDVLEYIEVDGDLLRGTKMSHTVSDGVLVFMVNYDCFVYKDIEPDPEMEILNVTTNAKGDEDNGS